MAGKGDKSRITNYQKYYENWDEISKPQTISAKLAIKLKHGKVRYVYTTKKEVKNDEELSGLSDA